MTFSQVSKMSQFLLPVFADPYYKEWESMRSIRIICNYLSFFPKKLNAYLKLTFALALILSN